MRAHQKSVDHTVKPFLRFLLVRILDLVGRGNVIVVFGLVARHSRLPPVASSALLAALPASLRHFLRVRVDAQGVHHGIVKAAVVLLALLLVRRLQRVLGRDGNPSADNNGG
jgi:hypothetical protein